MREKFDFKFDPKIDIWWDQEMSDSSDECPPVWLDAEDPLFILYTRFSLICYTFESNFKQFLSPTNSVEVRVNPKELSTQ